MTKKDTRLNMRMGVSDLNLIDAAASESGKNRTEFIRQAAMNAAQNTMLDRKNFLLEDEQWQEFMNALDNPTPINEKLAKLLASPAPWDINDQPPG